MMNKKNLTLLVCVLLVGLLAGAALTALPPVVLAVAAPTGTPAPRPEPPHIESWGIPDPAGGQPAECAGQVGCGVMCFYVSENAAANEFELSCIAWTFE